MSKQKEAHKHEDAVGVFVPTRGYLFVVLLEFRERKGPHLPGRVSEDFALESKD